MKSKTDELTEKAFYHAMNFFKHNDRGVDNQRVCIQQLMEITGFDFDTCLKIQNPVLSLYMADYTMSIGQSVIESNIQMVTQTIRNHLLDVQINYNQKTFDQKSSNSILSCKDIIEKTTNAPHGNLLSGVRIIDISKSNIRNEDIGVLVQHLQYQRLNLDKFDVSNNLLGYGAVENLFYTFSLSRSNTALYNIKFMNLSNNYIGDDGAKYISSHLSAGLHPNLRCLDVSGNNLSYEMCIGFSQVIQSIKQNIIIKVDKFSDVVKKQKTLFYSSKEEKQIVIKDYLKQVESKGVNTQNIAVSKDIFSKLDNSGYVLNDFSISFAKCYIIPESATSFAADKIIAKTFKKVFAVTLFTDAVLCLFEALGETASSQKGIQLFLDIGLVGTQELIDHVE